MIRSLFVRDLKCFVGTNEVHLAPITLIYGANSAGKSTLLQALLLLAQSLQTDDPDEQPLVVRGALVDLASYPSLAPWHDLNRRLMIGVDFDSSQRTRSDERFPGLRRLRLSYRWNRKSDSVDLSEVDLGVGELPMVQFLRRDPSIPSELERFGRSRPSYFVLDQRASKASAFTKLLLFLVDHQDEAVEIDSSTQAYASYLLRVESGQERPLFAARGLLPGPIRQMAHEDVGAQAYADNQLRMRMQWDTFSRSYNLDVERLCKGLAYLGPLRQPPQRFNIVSGGVRPNVGREGQYAVEVLAHRPELSELVNIWLSRLQVPYSLTVERVGREGVQATIGEVVSLVLTDRRTNVRVAPNDVGFGISQLLPIVVQGLLGQENVVCVEQPEIHVHPRLQAELADLFISAAEERGNQFLVETHSEHLVLRLQRRIRQRRIAPDFVSVLYVESTDDGTARVQRLRLDDNGEFLDEWPTGFFEERYNEIFKD
jgi:AAA ATPase domain/AAA domain, putative AbiEii toxin, Type IV TA system/Protein of unknown function (DUF3696)